MPSSNNTREDSTHGHHQIVDTKIRLIIFFAPKCCILVSFVEKIRDAKGTFHAKMGTVKY